METKCIIFIKDIIILAGKMLQYGYFNRHQYSKWRSADKKSPIRMHYDAIGHSLTI